MTAYFGPLTLLRGDDYAATWILTDQATGASLLEAGDVLTLHLKAFQGGSTLETLTGTPDANGSAITVANAATGEISVAISSVTLETWVTALATADSVGIPGDTLHGAFAFQLTRASKLTTYWYGPLILLPQP